MSFHDVMNVEETLKEHRMTKKFIREEWGRVDKKHIGNMYDTTCQICPDSDLLDLFQSFEDRIDEFKKENKSLRDDVNYLREKILSKEENTIIKGFRLHEGPAPIVGYENFITRDGFNFMAQNVFDKTEKPKRNFEILFANDKTILVTYKFANTDWCYILCNPLHHLKDENTFQEDFCSRMFGVEIILKEFKEALKEFKEK